MLGRSHAKTFSGEYSLEEDLPYLISYFRPFGIMAYYIRETFPKGCENYIFIGCMHDAINKLLEYLQCGISLWNI